MTDFDMNSFLRSRFQGEKRGRSLTVKDLDKFISDVFLKKHQRKLARVIYDVCEASEGFFSAEEVSNRLIQHINSGLYAGYGNLERWSNSETGPVSSEVE